jgi:methylated-DNA-[protein]-cysteine S-methyltransferase
VRIVFGGIDETGESDPVLFDAKRQLEEYFCGKRRAFDLPLSPGGTDFQKRVWRALTDIPYGETRSYADIAAAVGSPKGFRAVGMANHVNPIPIIIPCHRVIGKNGKLTGYAGGLDMKTSLLAMERENHQK